MASNKKTKRVSAGTRKTMQSKTPLLIRQTAAEDKHLKEVPHKALDTFAASAGTSNDWLTLVTRVTVGKHLTAHFNDSEITNIILEAATILADTNLHYGVTGRWAMSPEEIAVVKRSIECVDDLHDASTRRELLTAFNLTKSQMKGSA